MVTSFMFRFILFYLGIQRNFYLKFVLIHKAMVNEYDFETFNERQHFQKEGKIDGDQ